MVTDESKAREFKLPILTSEIFLLQELCLDATFNKGIHLLVAKYSENRETISFAHKFNNVYVLDNTNCFEDFDLCAPGTTTVWQNLIKSRYVSRYASIDFINTSFQICKDGNDLITCFGSMAHNDL